MGVKIFSSSSRFSFLNDGGPCWGGRKRGGGKVSTCQVPGPWRGGTKHSCRAAPRGLSGNCMLSPNWLGPWRGGQGSPRGVQPPSPTRSRQLPVSLQDSGGGVGRGPVGGGQRETGGEWAFHPQGAPQLEGQGLLLLGTPRQGCDGEMGLGER